MITNIQGQHSELSIEQLVLKEPCYHNYLTGENGNVETRTDQAGLIRFMDLTRRCSSLRLKLRCQRCLAEPATAIVVAFETKEFADRSGRVKPMATATAVQFSCDACAGEFDGIPMKPSTLSWPMQSPNDRFGAMRVRDALLRACGVPMLHKATQGQLEAFFRDDANFVPTMSAEAVR